MKHTFKTLPICLLTTTALCASPGVEEASQAPHGIKRLAEARTHEGADVRKRLKMEGCFQETVNEEDMVQETSLALLDLPTEVLTCMAQSLSSNKDL
ncbi:MAG: hypothetical protein LCH26_02180, partial [Proteobacteria bacterium]|nr:hypothetical protein [Pseudomonadota bacterium]